MKSLFDPMGVIGHGERPDDDAPAGMRSERRKPHLNRQAWCGTALVMTDLLALLLAALCVVGAAWSLWEWRLLGIRGGFTASHAMPHLVPVAVIGAGAMTYWGIQTHYSRRIPFWSELRQIVLASVAALLCHGLIQFSRQESGPRFSLVLIWLLFPVLVVALRAMAKGLLSQSGLWRIPALIVGEGETAHQAMNALLSEPRLGYDITATVSSASIEQSADRRPWTRVMRQFDAELVVLAPDSQAGPSRHAIEGLVRERVPFAVIPQLDGLPVLGFDQTQFFSHDTVMFAFRNNLAKPTARFLKVAFDVVATMAGLLVVCPVFLLIAVLVKLDGGPALFAHRRIGAGGKPFHCLKFRSMRADGDAVLRELLANDPEARAEWAETQKLRHDPRVTWIGKHLRRTSLDELPQLLNVLRLEMSLVGPRPIVQAEIARYGDNIAYYHETRPGLTGLWQVSGRSDTSYAQRIQLDTWYVKNWTLWHDIAILAKTLPAVLKRRGAH